MATDHAFRGAAMDEVPTRSHQNRFKWIALGAATALVLVIVVTVALLEGPSGAEPSAVRPSASSVPTGPKTNVRWEEVGGVSLPVSTTHGPRLRTGGRASGYSRSESGAALAAAQVLMRTSATSGSDVFLPVIATQVTGANVAAFKATTLQEYERLRAQTAVASGAPIPGADARIDGYRITRYGETSGTATVEVVVDSPTLSARQQLVGFAVSLQWSYDDWRVIAPARGDWGSVATELGSPPAGLLTYDQIG
jgi:hypothetical protein